MLGRALRASYPKRHTSQGESAQAQGERMDEKWGRRGRGVARVWIGEGFHKRPQGCLFKNPHPGWAQGCPEGTFAPRYFLKKWIFLFLPLAAPGSVRRVPWWLNRVAKGSTYTPDMPKRVRRTRSYHQLKRARSIGFGTPTAERTHRRRR